MAFYAILLTPRVASAQVATPLQHFGFTEVGQTVAQAAGAGVSYNLYDNSSTTPIPLTGLACVAATVPANSDCTTSIPALTTGIHVVTVTQQVTVTAGPAESGKSNVLSFTMVLVVTPSGLIVKP